MSYDIDKTKVTWKGRAVKGAEPTSFRTLAPIIGMDANSVFVLGKKIAANAKTFRMRGTGYAADMLTVWRVLETKLKPLKADAKTFEAIGPDHGRDAKTAFYKDKRLQLAKGTPTSALQPLTGSLSTDGTHLFHASKRVHQSDKCAINWANCQARILSKDNDMNVPIAAFQDAGGVWLLDLWAQTSKYMRLEGADFAALRIVPPRFWRAGQNYVTDGAQVWYHGMPVEGASGEGAEAVSGHILAQGGSLWTGQRLFPLSDADCAVGASDQAARYLHTRDGLFSVSFKGASHKLANAETYDIDADAALTTWLRAVVQDCHGIFLTLATGRWSNDGELISDMRPWGRARDIRAEFVSAPAPNITARFDGPHIIVEGGDLAEPLRDRACAWGRMVQHICLKLTGQEGLYRPISRLNGYPEGSELHRVLALRHATAMIDMASALYASEPTEACAMLHLIWDRITYMQDKEALYPAMARMPLGLVASAQYQCTPYGYVEATTHLAGVRFLLSKDCLKDPDWRIRHEYAGLLHSLVWATGKPTLVMTEIMQVFDDLAASEDHPMITEVFASMLHVMVAKCERVARRPAKGEDVSAIHPWALRKAIAWGVTPERYRVRLQEIDRAAT